MAYETDNQYGDQEGRYGRNQDSIYSKRIKAGKRRTYFFDVRATRGNDYFITITESKKRFEDGGYDRHKMFLYKEDFHKFINALAETVNYVKTDLMPDFDFDAYNHDEVEEGSYVPAADANAIATVPVVESAVTEAENIIAQAAPAPETQLDDTDVDGWKA